MKKIIAIVVVVVVAGALWYSYTQKQTPKVSMPDYKNISYVIDGETVTLIDGHAEGAEIPGSVSRTETQYFGNLAKGDVNGDGIPDLAFLVTQNGGGSGTFYFVVVALQTTDGGYTGTNGVLLGDRIAPQTTEIKDGQVIVNYADRKPNEPMTTEPSVGVSKYFKVQGTTLTETQ